MKTGLDIVVEPSRDVDEFVEQSSSLFLVLLEEAMRSAATYAKATDRDVVTADDVLYGMQYQAHQFSNVNNVHLRATEAAKEMKRIEADADADSDEETDADSDDDFVVDDENCPPFARAPDSHSDVIALMNHYHDTWESWVPETDVERLLKESIDSNRVSDTSINRSTA